MNESTTVPAADTALEYVTGHSDIPWLWLTAWIVVIGLPTVWVAVRGVRVRVTLDKGCKPDPP